MTVAHRFAHAHFSAPGKVVLLGEHAVVYGTRAIAASLDLRTHVLGSAHFAQHAEPFVTLNISMPDIGITSFTAPNFKPMVPNDLDEDQLLAVESVSAIFAAVVATCPSPPSYIRVTVKSTISPGSGLGSSAALCVAIAGVALRLTWGASKKIDMTEVDNLAIIGERIFHGTPSGVDNAVCARGGLLIFQRGVTPSRLHFANRIPCFVIDSKQKKCTAEIVARTKMFLDEGGPERKKIISDIGDVVEGAIAAEALNFSTLAPLIENNQKLLSRLPLMTETLNLILGACKQAEDFLKISAKITGAGGGGSVLGIAASLSEANEAADFLRKNFHFPVYVTVLGGNGLTEFDHSVDSADLNIIHEQFLLKISNPDIRKSYDE